MFCFTCPLGNYYYPRSNILLCESLVSLTIRALSIINSLTKLCYFGWSWCEIFTFWTSLLYSTKLRKFFLSEFVFLSRTILFAIYAATYAYKISSFLFCVDCLVYNSDVEFQCCPKMYSCIEKVYSFCLVSWQFSIQDVALMVCGADLKHFRFTQSNLTGFVMLYIPVSPSKHCRLSIPTFCCSPLMYFRAHTSSKKEKLEHEKVWLHYLYFQCWTKQYDGEDPVCNISDTIH